MMQRECTFRFGITCSVKEWDLVSLVVTGLFPHTLYVDGITRWPKSRQSRQERESIVLFQLIDLPLMLIAYSLKLSMYLPFPSWPNPTAVHRKRTGSRIWFGK